jgi:hypothetical protein
MNITFTIDELISEDFNIENLLTINMFIKKRMIDMKYVKFFEEFGYEETKELIKFCKDNLAYLIDDGYKVVE